MARRQWSSKQGKYITVENVERNRKSALIVAAVRARGLQPRQNYRDDTFLFVGKGVWEVQMDYDREGYLQGSIRAESFDDLLATLTDDLRFARHVYQHCTTFNALADALRGADYDLATRKKHYGQAVVDLAMGKLEGVDAPTLRDRDNRAIDAEARLISAFDAQRDARAAFDAYMAAMPQDEDAARAYLVTVGGVVAQEQVELGA